MSSLTLRVPKEDEEEGSCGLIAPLHRRFRPSSTHYEEGMPFRRYLEVLAEQEQGINLPSANHVPSTFLLRLSTTESWDAMSIRHSP